MAAESSSATATLAATVADALGADEVSDLTRLSGGASRETWSVRVDGVQRIVQRQRAGDERDMLTEADVVRAAGQAGVRVPALLAAERADDGACFMVLEHVEGETIARKILRDDEYAAARPRLPGDFGRALAAIHRIDPEPLSQLPDVDQIEWYTDILDQLAQPSPMLELVRRWLIDHRPTATRRCLVHGDFRLGNVIVDPDGLAAVIDWELAHVGDPMEDLGWLCVKAWRFGSPKPVAGVGDYEELFGAYEDASGVTVDPAVVRWWEVLGTWKWAIMCITQCNAHRAGLARSHELAAIGRRVAENEHDLFLALGGSLVSDAPLLPEVGSPVSDLHGAPTAAELVESVREWLERDVAPQVEARLRFHTRVAVNVLAMVERELELGDAQRAAHAERLASLGVADDAELAAAIRAGDLDDRADEVRRAVRAAVTDKLRVANPRYLDG